MPSRDVKLSVGPAQVDAHGTCSMSFRNTRSIHQTRLPDLAPECMYAVANPRGCGCCVFVGITDSKARSVSAFFFF